MQYIEKQIETLEHGIRKSWALVKKPNNGKWGEFMSYMFSNI